MPINLSIRNVPDDVADRLRARAARNHRSLQGELMAIFESAVRPGSGMQEDQREYHAEQPTPEKRKLTVREVGEEAEKLAIYQPGDEPGTQIIRRHRDGGHVSSRQPLDAVEALEQMRKLGVRTKDEVVRMIREDRDR
jgi:plasmid stability protein